MQVTYTNDRRGARPHRPIGQIRVVGQWRAVGASAESDRQAALRALIQEAESYDADAILGVRFEVDSVGSPDVDATPLKRVTATALAVKYAEAA
jgi:uncharacterized protein YbjQ (UPF0145 family)